MIATSENFIFISILLQNIYINCHINNQRILGTIHKYYKNTDKYIK